MFCRFCGTQLSDNSLFCDKCGNAVEGSTDNSGSFVKKHKVTIFRKSQLYLINPPVNISINNKKNLSIGNGQTLELDLDEGYYIFEFSLHVRKRTVEFNLDKDTQINLKWDRITGALKAALS